MTLEEFCSYLTYGEFSQINIGGIEFSNISKENYPAITTNINLGLVEIYKRFNIKIDEVNVLVQEGTVRYNLSKNHAVTNPNNTSDVLYPKYINDSISHPFDNNILTIYEVEDPEEALLPYNLENATKTSFLLVEPGVIKMPSDYAETSFTVKYRATPQKLSTSQEIDPALIEIPLGDAYTEALLNYTVYKIINGIDPRDATGVSYYQKFISSVQEIRSSGLANILNIENTKLESNGWL